jgi:hypothetical protein
MPHESLRETLQSARTLMVALEGHIDKAAEVGDLAEVGRAWVRAAQLERMLRSVLPPGATDIPEVKDLNKK